MEKPKSLSFFLLENGDGTIVIVLIRNTHSSFSSNFLNLVVLMLKVHFRFKIGYCSRFQPPFFCLKLMFCCW